MGIIMTKQDLEKIIIQVIELKAYISKLEAENKILKDFYESNKKRD